MSVTERSLDIYTVTLTNSEMKEAFDTRTPIIETVAGISLRFWVDQAQWPRQEANSPQYPLHYSGEIQGADIPGFSKRTELSLQFRVLPDGHLQSLSQ